MEKIRLKVVAALLAGLALFTLSAGAEEEIWKFIKFNDDIFAYYDAQNISHLPDGHVKVWMKVIPMPESAAYAKIREEVKKYGIEKEFLSLHILYDIDCTRNSGSQVEIVCFDRQKTVIDTLQIKKETGEISIPIQMIEMVGNKICK